MLSQDALYISRRSSAPQKIAGIRERAGARALLEEVTYVELSDRPDFNDKFVDQLGF